MHLFIYVYIFNLSSENIQIYFYTKNLMISYSGLSPVDSSVTHSHLLTPHEMEWGREQEWYKWDKYFLIGNIKVMYTSKKFLQEFIHLFPWAGCCSALLRKAELHHTLQWPGTANATTPSAFCFSFFPLLLLLIVILCDVGCPLGQLSQLCPFQASCTSPAFSPVEWCEK